MTQTDWRGHSRGSAEYRRILVALFCAGVATFAQLYSPQSILAVISEDVGVSPADAALTISVATGAVAVGVIPWALIAGRFGRARVMSIAVTLSAVTGCLVLLAPTFEVLLVGRAIEGFMLAAIPAVAVAYLAEEIVAEHSPVAAGVYVAGTTVGGLLGRVAAGPIAEFAGWRIAMLAVAIVCLLAAVAFVVLIPRPRRGASS